MNTSDEEMARLLPAVEPRWMTCAKGEHEEMEPRDSGYTHTLPRYGVELRVCRHCRVVFVERT